MKEELLRIEGLTVTFKGMGRQRIQAVSNLGFNITRSETMGLVGESGCGKSTIARSIMQLPRPVSGRILFDGEDLTQIGKHRLRQLRPRFQMIFQDSVSSLNPRRTIIDALTAPLKVVGISPRKERIRRALEMLASVGIAPESAHLKPFQFSGGQCQRIQIARALMADPELLICDEPVSSLDVSVQAQIINLLEDMKKAHGLTMLFISHDLGVVKNICDRVMVMYLGKLCELAPCDRLYHTHFHPYTRALLNAVPKPDPGGLPYKGNLLAGEKPSPFNPPSGCRFRTRCPNAKPRCSLEEPVLREMEPGHRAACHFPIRPAQHKGAKPPGAWDMEPADRPCFETLATQYLGPGFPPHLSGAVSLSGLPPDTREFVVRLLALMKDAQYSLTQFNPVLTRWLRFTVPAILPGAWEGRIPPITVPGRHQKLDDYLAGSTGQTFGPDPLPRIFLDIGCGFPPVTTADTAIRFPHWQIYGVDRSFADYVVYDAKGHYACFDQRGRFLYFQPSTDGSARALYSDPKGTKALFCHRFKDLYPLLHNKNGQVSETVKKDGNKLIHHHIKDFETDNLGFIRSDIMDLKQMTAQVIRCMNVFIYFSPDTRRKMLKQLTRHLDHKGLVIAGTNSFGIQSRYTVYQKTPRELSVREFAFSLDNLGHIALMPWFTLHDNDPEAMLLAQLSAILRSTASFWNPFSTHLDQLLECHGLCKRKVDGFLHFPTQEVLPNTFLEKNGLVWQEMEKKGYAQRAVDILGTAGHEAWINPAGDIAVRPPAGYGTHPLWE